MKRSNALWITGLLAVAELTMASSAWAQNNTYVCDVRLETGFAKDSENALAGTNAVTIRARLNDKPYCRGQAGETITLETPPLELKRKRNDALIHPILVHNALQGALASFLGFEIAAAQGSPMNRAITISTDPEAPAPHDYGFQATRPASVKASMPAAAAGKSGSDVIGYVCLARSKYLLGGDLTIPTVNDTQTFELRLHDKPFCLGKQVLSKQYDVGPAMRLPRKANERPYALTRRMNASAVMRTIYIAFIEAAVAGQRVTITHTPDGLIAAVELQARPRDLINEVKTISMPR